MSTIRTRTALELSVLTVIFNTHNINQRTHHQVYPATAGGPVFIRVINGAAYWRGSPGFAVWSIPADGRVFKNLQY